MAGQCGRAATASAEASDGCPALGAWHEGNAGVTDDVLDCLRVHAAWVWHDDRAGAAWYLGYDHKLCSLHRAIPVFGSRLAAPSRQHVSFTVGCAMERAPLCVEALDAMRSRRACFRPGKFFGFIPRLLVFLEGLAVRSYSQYRQIRLSRTPDRRLRISPFPYYG